MTQPEKILIVGSGAREHALCWKLKLDDPTIQLFAAPGNPGIAEIATCRKVSATDIDEINRLAVELKVTLVIIGPEAPLAAGLSDKLRNSGLTVFGPSAAAARIESSKSFAKELMLRAGVPTAMATTHRSPDRAKQAAAGITSAGSPVVIKASGLAAGKGVVIAHDTEAATLAIGDIFALNKALGNEPEVLVEEFMTGEELSVFALSDGENFVLLPASQDHKRLLENDEGPNTGGMGAYAPVSLATEALLKTTADEIIAPTLDAMASEGTPFSGLLYAGLMLTGNGPRVVEFNCRFGDPETQVVLPLIDESLHELLRAAATPGGLRNARTPATKAISALTTVIAARGYPARPETGARIQMPEQLPDDVLVFHAGTARNSDGQLVTSGGRVFSVTGLGRTLADARQASQSAAEQILFDGAHYRRDIAWREIARH